jgi:hypothetical protein
MALYESAAKCHHLDKVGNLQQNRSRIRQRLQATTTRAVANNPGLHVGPVVNKPPIIWACSVQIVIRLTGAPETPH